MKLTTNTIWMRYCLRCIRDDIYFLNGRALVRDVAKLFNPKFYTWGKHV